jgi:hypothetical protein
VAGVTERIELFGGQGWSLAGVHDAATGGYRVPWPTAADIPSLAFDPGRWSEELLSGPDPATAEGFVTAVVDTGVLAAHPLIAPRLTANADFTGHGTEDTHGHGTHLGIITVLVAPNSYLLSAKAVAFDDAPYEAQVERLANAVRWATEQRVTSISLAAGDSRGCREVHRPLCDAVREAVEAGVLVVVAGEAKCPAECHPDVIVAGTALPGGRVVTATKTDVNVFAGSDTVAILEYDEWLARARSALREHGSDGATTTGRT